MRDMFASIPCLCPYRQATSVGQLSRIIGAMVAMSGRVPMVGIAHWAGPGGSDRTVQRFLYTVMAWPVRLWGCCRQHGLEPTDTDVFAGDAWVMTKAGKQPYGLDRVCSSVYGQPVPGLSCVA
jgi:putative transposase